MLYAKFKLSRLVLSCAFFLMSLVVYSFYTYTTIYNDVMRTIDNRLLNAATSVKYVLGEQYHNTLPVRIGPLTYQSKSKQLSQLARDLNVDYLYAMVSINDSIYFSASSYTKEDQTNGKVTQFLDLYPSATAINSTAFLSTEPTFEVSNAHWGHFRTVFIPYIDGNGRTYLTAADIKIATINQALIARFKSAIPSSLVFLAALLLIMLFYHYGVKRSLMRDTATGFANYTALEKHLKKSHIHHMQIATILVNEIDNISRFSGTNIANNVMKKLLTHFKQRSDFECQFFRIANNKIVLLTSKDVPTETLSSLIQTHNPMVPFLTQPFIFITLNTGIARGNKSLLLKNSHIALLQAKQGDHAIVNYSEALNDSKSLYLYNVEIAKEVHKAFAANRVVPYFQAVVDINTHNTLWHDCTARIVTAQGEILTPDAFSSTIKRLRMHGPLTKTLFEQCVNRFRKTHVNWNLTLSAEDILDPIVNEYIAFELHRYPSPKCITISILESQVIENYYEVKEFITMVKSKGAKIVMNCWGGEFINTLNVIKVDIDGIKIDGALTSQILNDERISEFFEHISDFTQQHKLSLVADHVENKAITQLLIKANVTLMQGNYIAKPTPHINVLN